MGLMSDLAELAGETVRRKRSEKANANLSAEASDYLKRMTESAQSGNVEDMFTLGCNYFEGKILGYDPDAACYWWTEAANRGYIPAQHNLGLLYHGNLSKYYYDEEKAGYWLSVAATNGDQEAAEMLNAYYEFSRFKGKWRRK